MSLNNKWKISVLSRKSLLSLSVLSVVVSVIFGKAVFKLFEISTLCYLQGDSPSKRHLPETRPPNFDVSGKILPGTWIGLYWFRSLYLLIFLPFFHLPSFLLSHTLPSHSPLSLPLHNLSRMT